MGLMQQLSPKALMLSLGLIVPTQANIGSAKFAPGTSRITIMGVNVAGDAPPADYRQASAVEAAYSLPGVQVDGNGIHWVPAARSLIPEWFGAVADATGAAGVGTDSATALNNMIQMATALGARAVVPAGKIYRMATFTTTPAYGARTCLYLKKDTTLIVRGVLVHDANDSATNGGIVNAISTNGSPSVQAVNANLIFEGSGRIVFPAKPTGTGRNTRFGINFYYTSFSVLLGARTTANALGDTWGSFNVALSHCTDMAIDGGMVGLPFGGQNTGEDGLHFFGACQRITAGNIHLHSGDDAISYTMESGVNGLTMSDIKLFNVMASTYSGKVIKIHNDGAAYVAGNQGAQNCTIKNLTIDNVKGYARGPASGGAVAVLNESASCTLTGIKIRAFDFDYGDAVKTNPDVGSGSGAAVTVHAASKVHFTDCTIRNFNESGLVFNAATSCSWEGGSITSTQTLPVMLANVTVTGLMNTSDISGAVAGYRRVFLSGSPDLSAITAAINTAKAAAQLIDNRWPVVTLSGMSTASPQNGVNNGTFRVIGAGVDGSNVSYLDTENFRPGGGSTAEPSAPSGALATISLSRNPDLYVMSSTDCRVETTINNPQGWCAAYVGDRTGYSVDTELLLRIKDQAFGHGIFVSRSIGNRLGVVGRRIGTGGYGVYIDSFTGAPTPYNHVLYIDDNSARNDGLRGWARTAYSNFNADRLENIRGKTNSKVSGTFQTPANQAASNPISASVSVLATVPTAAITPGWFRCTPRSQVTGTPYVTFDSSAVTFTVTLPTAPAAIVTWDYVIEQPAG